MPNFIFFCFFCFLSGESSKISGGTSRGDEQGRDWDGRIKGGLDPRKTIKKTEMNNCVSFTFSYTIEILSKWQYTNDRKNIKKLYNPSYLFIKYKKKA